MEGTLTVIPMARVGVAGVGDPRLLESGTHLSRSRRRSDSGSSFTADGTASREHEPREPGEGFVSLLGQVHKGHGAGSPLH